MTWYEVSEEDYDVARKAGELRRIIDQYGPNKDSEVEYNGWAAITGRTYEVWEE